MSGTGRGIQKIVLAVSLLTAVPVFAQTNSKSKVAWDKATAVSVSFTDDFFNDNAHFKLSGCEQSVWSAIHLAIIAELNRQDLREDQTRAAQIKECYEIVWAKEAMKFPVLQDSIGRNSKDESLRLLDEEDVLWHVESFAVEAYESYSKRLWLNR